VGMKVYIVDDDADIRESLIRLFAREEIDTEAFANAKEFLESCHPMMWGCILLDIDMPEMSGMELQGILQERGVCTPIIFLTGFGDVPSSSRAFRQGALDFLEKPIDSQILLDRVGEAFAAEREQARLRERQRELLERAAKLSARERDVLKLVVQGLSSKEVAKALCISHRTVHSYRASLMEKTHSKSLADLAVLAMAAGLNEPD